MQEISRSKLIEQKSKFFGYLFRIDNEEEIKEVLEKVSSENKKIRHICYASNLDYHESFKNDGEVGSPGKVLLEILRNKKLNNHILVVSRIFGGIKLGPAGVAKAFKNCAKSCV